MKAAVIAFSERGQALGERVVSYFLQNGETAGLTRCKEGGLGEWTKTHFQEDALIFIGSCGIAVRAVAPFLRSKTSDPAVVVIDEFAACAVSLLSGHLGGANDLTVRLARFLEALPVVTTATDVHGVFAIDAWAVKRGLKIGNPERIKWISARLLAGESIGIQSVFPVTGRLPAGVTLCEKGGDVLITYRTRGREETLRLIPPVITLGIGCKRNVTAETIKRAFGLMLKKASCHPLAVARVCSIDQKAREPGILEFCHTQGLPYQTFPAQELLAVPGIYTASAFVKQVTGVDNVCERSAVLGSGKGGRLLTGKDAGNGVTMALAISPYTIRFDEGEAI
ncbi:MAG: cobalamin biosynthesis protein [Clostridia bacterium]|jgi:cobalt-precorrin 5A hydrolase|nr:cobalamin biosynthesis protein [Clostridia bacterium]